MSLEVAAAILGLALGLPAVLLYHRLVAYRNQARQGFADVDAQLKRRADLVPRLVEAASAYAAREGVLTAVAELRSAALGASRPALLPRDRPRRRAAQAGAAAGGLPAAQGRRQFPRALGAAGRDREAARVRPALLQRRGDAVRH